MQGATLAAKNVAFCSTDANSTIRWAYNRGGGEGGIRTHGRVSPTLAFEASSFNRSDTSPRLFVHSNGAATAGQCPSIWQSLRPLAPTLLFACRPIAKRKEGRDALAVFFVARPEASR